MCGPAGDKRQWSLDQPGLGESGWRASPPADALSKAINLVARPLFLGPLPESAAKRLPGGPAAG
jgi:hypothetical protein